MSGRRQAESVQDIPYPEEEGIHEPGVHHLRAKAAMYRGGAAGHRARFLRGRPGGHASPGERRSDLDEAPAGTGRTSFWDHEMADGPPQVPGTRVEKSQS